jgi:hypothetical protein
MLMKLTAGQTKRYNVNQILIIHYQRFILHKQFLTNGIFQM